jgi:hypothetical protein
VEIVKNPSEHLSNYDCLATEFRYKNIRAYMEDPHINEAIAKALATEFMRQAIRRATEEVNGSD